MSDTTFNSVQDLKAWAEKLEFINQLEKTDYDKFLKIYDRLLFFDNFFMRLSGMNKIIRDIKIVYEPLKEMFDSGELKKFVELSDKIKSIIGDDY